MNFSSFIKCRQLVISTPSHSTYLNVEIIIVPFGQLNEESEEREGGFGDEEEALGPHHHEGEDTQEHR